MKDNIYKKANQKEKHIQNRFLIESRFRTGMNLENFALTAAGVDPIQYSEIENLEVFPNPRVQEDIAMYLRNETGDHSLTPGRLFPKNLYYSKMFEQKEEFEDLETENNIESFINNEYKKEKIKEVLNTLPDRQRDVLSIYFGLEEDNLSDEGVNEKTRDYLDKTRLTLEEFDEIKDEAIRKLRKYEIRKSLIDCWD